MLSKEEALRKEEGPLRRLRLLAKKGVVMKMHSAALIFCISLCGLQPLQAEENSGPPASVWDVNVGLNAIINTGNSSNQTLGGESSIGWKKDKDSVQWSIKGAYGRARLSGVTETVTNNLRTELRYDRRILKKLTTYVAGNAGYDKPAGFNLRAGGSIGLAHTVIEKEHSTWRYEFGPDYSREERTNNTQFDIYSGRIFNFFEYRFNKHVRVSEGFEALFNFENGDDIRLNSITKLVAKMTELLSFQLSFDLRTDFVPVPGFQELDTTTSAGLAIDLL